MRKLIFFIPLVLLMRLAIAQNSHDSTKPVIIEGQITNLNSKEITIGYAIQDGYVYDVAKVDSTGRFYLKTNKFNKPVRADVGANSSLLTYLYVAPGYHLKITGDAKTRIIFGYTKQISGYGSTVNKFMFKRDSVFMRSFTGKEAYQMNTNELVAFLKKRAKSSDSISRIIFNGKLPHDEYYSIFKEEALLNARFETLYYLVGHTIDENKKFTSAQSTDFISSNFEPDINKITYNPKNDYLPKVAKPGILSNLFNKEYMKSDDYRMMMGGDYPIFLWDQQYRKDSTKVNKKRYNIDLIKIIANDYKGDIKNAVLYHKLFNVVYYCRSFEELYDYKTAFPPYIAQLPDTAQQGRIYKLLATKEKELIKTATGQTAPLFTAEDSTGKKYSLADLKGKVVYIDLWASWCGPCRGETPYLKRIVDKYKSDDRIIIMSVAVLDKPDNWRVALREDKPTWLQLYDVDGTAQRGYSANSIPKFIVVSKQGKIVALDAPPPHDPAALSRMLDEEIAKTN